MKEKNLKGKTKIAKKIFENYQHCLLNFYQKCSKANIFYKSDRNVRNFRQFVTSPEVHVIVSNIIRIIDFFNYHSYLF